MNELHEWGDRRGGPRADLRQDDLGPVSTGRILQRFNEERNCLVTEVGKRVKRWHHRDRIRIGQLPPHDLSEFLPRCAYPSQRPHRCPPDAWVRMNHRCHQGLDGGRIHGRVRSGNHVANVITPDMVDRRNGLGDDNWIGIAQKFQQRWNSGQGLAAQKPDCTGGVPPHPRLGVGQRCNQQLERRLGIGVNRREFVDRNNAGAAVGSLGGEQPDEVLNAIGHATTSSRGR